MSKFVWDEGDVWIVPTATELLAQLRQSYEQEGGNLNDEMPFALLLNDVCTALDLSDEERGAVLGPQGLACLAVWGDTPVSLGEK